VILNVGVAGSVRFQDIQSKGVTGIKLETKGFRDADSSAPLGMESILGCGMEKDLGRG
jgi:hypothetical protein